MSNGEVIFGATVAQRVARYFADIRPAPLSELFPELTGRECDILGLIAQNLSHHDIALHLSLSEKTVRNHASNIFSKLQVADRVQAVILARAAGLG